MNPNVAASAFLLRQFIKYLRQTLPKVYHVESCPARDNPQVTLTSSGPGVSQQTNNVVNIEIVSMTYLALRQHGPSAHRYPALNYLMKRHLLLLKLGHQTTVSTT